MDFTNALAVVGPVKVEDWSDGDTRRARVGFANGYQASIVRGPGSYGGNEGLFEAAVMHGKDGIVYDTPVTNDVEGWLTEEGVIDFCRKVAALPPRAVR